MKFSKKIKNKTVIVSLLLIAIVVSGITLAILLDTPYGLTNTFELGDVTTDIEEPDITYDENINKSPYIKNNGKSAALVRAKVTISPKELEERFNLTINYKTDKWKYYNGYYYYMDVLQPNNSTEPLFEEVNGTDIVITDDSGNKVINPGLEGLEITIYHESVQAEFEDKKPNTGDPTNSDVQYIWEAYENAK
ncbi:MAG: hypothetical protein U0N20_07035 [Clostridium sp.]